MRQHKLGVAQITIRAVRRLKSVKIAVGIIITVPAYGKGKEGFVVELVLAAPTLLNESAFAVGSGVVNEDAYPRRFLTNCIN